MKKHVALSTGLLVLALIVGFAGCGGGEATPTPVVTPSPGATPTPTLEPITHKLVTSSPDNGLAAEAYYHFADLVEEYTGGQVKVDVYPGSQLLPATEQWEAVATGSIDIVADSSYYMSAHVPDMMIFYIDGIWESYEHAYAVLEDSSLPEILAEKTAAAAPVKLLGILPGSMPLCVLNSVRETREFADFEGFKTQSSPGSPATAMYDYSGMAAIPIAYEELVAAFSQGVIDAIHMPPFVITDLQLYETGEHMLCRTALFANFTITVNEGSWESLPGDVQDIIVDRIMPEIYEYGKRVAREAADDALELIAQNVETVHCATGEDIEPFEEYARTHPVTKVQMLFVDPEIVQIIEDKRPSKAQQ